MYNRIDRGGFSSLIAMARRSIFVLSLAAGSQIAYAGFASEAGLTDSEILLLPKYCPDTMNFTIYGNSVSNPSPRANYWISLMGPSFWAMHHYCIARVNMLRAQKAGISRTQRDALLANVQGNCQYVIENSRSDFVMLPEVLTLRGDASLKLGQIQKANEAYSRARQLKPDYWPAYTRWAEFLIAAGRRGDALSLVTAGLAEAPGNKLLLEQYRLLGGKPADLPKPAVRKESEVPPTATPPDARPQVRDDDANPSENRLQQP